MSHLETRLMRLIEELHREYNAEYIMAALKQINDQQLLHISFKGYRIPNDPILKIYEQVVREIEAVLFASPDDIPSEAELRRLLEKARTHVACL